MYSFSPISIQAAKDDDMLKQLAIGTLSFNGCRILKRAEFELTGVYDGEHDICCLDVDILQLLLLIKYRIRWKY
jgi:tRNA threonylcarbamoyladenosine modification (KEOPS) complex Cgi121 subunit